MRCHRWRRGDLQHDDVDDEKPEKRVPKRVMRARRRRRCTTTVRRRIGMTLDQAAERNQQAPVLRKTERRERPSGSARRSAARRRGSEMSCDDTLPFQPESCSVDVQRLDRPGVGEQAAIRGLHAATAGRNSYAPQDPWQVLDSRSTRLWSQVVLLPVFS